MKSRLFAAALLYVAAQANADIEIMGTGEALASRGRSEDRQTIDLSAQGLFWNSECNFQKSNEFDHNHNHTRG